ncbi:hypothetical protein niasHS_002908 [Heterodera schachtii]|uniref:Glutathione synthetase n=1 Tax=Heterodera schachtii TaxID=97005 RepID=A0ABD2K950_HETSC
MNLLYFRVSQDHAFLIETLEPLAETSFHIRVWLELLREIQSEGIHQPISLILMRSDYMSHIKNNEHEIKKMDYELKQVEINIGPYGGAAHGGHMTKFHRKMMEKAGRRVKSDSMPDNEGAEQLAEGLYEAWKLFKNPNAIVLIVADTMNRTYEMSQIDQILIQLAKNDNYKLKIVNLALHECDKRLTLDEAGDFSLHLGDQIVGVVHFKTFCFHPNKAQKDSRRKIERSTAIKCPDVGSDLSNMKKVQQAIAMPGTLERFFPDPNEAEMIVELRASFAGMWGLGNEDEDTKNIINDAIENPGNYVLKPSKEGGGNNTWGDEIAEKLKAFTKKQLEAHILMQRLKPIVGKNYLVYAHRDVVYTDTTSELSTFGYLLGDVPNMKVLHNVSKGHMMRTKPESVNEGGVEAGGGVHDSPYLI